MISIKYRMGDNPAQTTTITQSHLADEQVLLTALFFKAGESTLPALGFYVGQLSEVAGKTVAMCFMGNDHIPSELQYQPVHMSDAHSTLTILKQTKSELGGNVDAFALLKKVISTESVDELERDYQKVAPNTSKIELHTQACLYVSPPDTGVCTPMPSEWSRPITWDMVNLPNRSGWVSVSPDASGSPNYGIDLSVHNTVRKFFGEVQKRLSHDAPIELDFMDDDRVRIRFVPPARLNVGDTPQELSYNQRGDFGVRNSAYIGNMAETTLSLADAFDSPPVVTTCVYGYIDGLPVLEAE